MKARKFFLLSGRLVRPGEAVDPEELTGEQLEKLTRAGALEALEPEAGEAESAEPEAGEAESAEPEAGEVEAAEPEAAPAEEPEDGEPEEALEIDVSAGIVTEKKARPGRGKRK